MKFLHFVLCPLICSRVLQFRVYGNLNRICILLLCENCINLNYVELLHSAFQVYYILLLFCLLIILIFLIYNFIYLAVLHLSCSMHTHVETCGILVPLDQTQALCIGSTQS